MLEGLLVLGGTAAVRLIFVGESQTVLVATVEEAMEVLPAAQLLTRKSGRYVVADVVVPH